MTDDQPDAEQARKLAALDVFVAEFEAEHGIITPAEMDTARAALSARRPGRLRP